MIDRHVYAMGSGHIDKCLAFAVLLALRILSLDESFVLPVAAWSISLPGGRCIRYNDDTGVLRINLEGDTSTSAMTKEEKEKLIASLSKHSRPSQNTLDAIQIRPTDMKGNGAFALMPLPKHTFLGFYVGDLIRSREELDKRYANDDSLKNERSNKIRRMDHIMSLDGGVTFLDGSRLAKDITKFTPAHLNHADKGTLHCNCIRILIDDIESSSIVSSSNKNNVKIQTEKVDDNNMLCPGVAFFTARDILKGEELCIDYGTDYWRGREHEKI